MIPNGASGMLTMRAEVKLVAVIPPSVAIPKLPPHSVFRIDALDVRRWWRGICSLRTSTKVPLISARNREIAGVALGSSVGCSVE
jgi:hypothetical protein